MNLKVIQINKSYMKKYFTDNLIVPESVLGIYTTKSQAIQINKIIKMYSQPDYIITDSTACIGGNSYYFLKNFKRVNLVEPDFENFNILKINTNYQINTFNCSYNCLKFILRQDIVYFDPPWGGADYKSKKEIDLYLDNINVLDIINEIYNYTKIVALKVPNNFNIFSIENRFWKFNIHSIIKNKKCIYKLIIFHKS
tara:strand:- start:92 stop:682 length:591 start_codon:yes stop_codon:yes gene_type:complete